MAAKPQGLSGSISGLAAPGNSPGNSVHARAEFCAQILLGLAHEHL
jgi:hypothetical protein